jgi:hypothetical protein
VHCREEWVDLLTLYERDECSVRLRDKVERLRADLDALSRAVGQALVASSLAAGETLAEPIPHIIVSTVRRLRAEALGQRADNATVGALAYADGRDDECAAVVARLREWGSVGRIATAYDYANEIERGEHRREGET